MKSNRFITATKADREFLMKVFKVSSVCVWQALNYVKDTDQARKIRHLQKQRGGVVMMVTPEMETMHDADGYIRQYFPNGAMLEIKKGTDECAVYHKGIRIKSGKVDFATIGAVQAYANALR